MTQLFYNGYAFLPNSVWFRISQRAVLGRTNRRAFVEEVWFINGRVQGASTSEVVTNAELLTGALDDGGDLVFDPYHQILSGDCADGTHVEGFEWLSGYDGVRGSGAELLFRRTFQLRIRGTKVATDLDTDIFAYEESVSGYGTGLPQAVPAGSLFGKPQPQQVAAYTGYSSIQRGSAIGLTTTPPASTPIWISTAGVYYDQESLGGAIATPIRWGINQDTLYRITWSYKAWSPTIPMVMNPLSFI